MAARAWEAQPDVFIGAQRKPLRRRGAKPPGDAARSDSAESAHASISERGMDRCYPGGGSHADHRSGQRRLTDGDCEAARQTCSCGVPTMSDCPCACSRGGNDEAFQTAVRCVNPRSVCGGGWAETMR